jgi:hypothetical protein
LQLDDLQRISRSGEGVGKEWSRHKEQWAPPMSLFARPEALACPVALHWSWSSHDLGLGLLRERSLNRRPERARPQWQRRSRRKIADPKTWIAERGCFIAV